MPTLLQECTPICFGRPPRRDVAGGGGVDKYPFEMLVDLLEGGTIFILTADLHPPGQPVVDRVDLRCVVVDQYSLVALHTAKCKRHSNFSRLWVRPSDPARQDQQWLRVKHAW
eukprot:92861-Amphidinium_carterae.1